MPKVNHSRSNSRQSIDADAGDDMDTAPPAKNHKYVIEAEVLKDSWPLSPSNWEFVNKLQEAEKLELKGELVLDFHAKDGVLLQYIFSLTDYN